MMKKQVQKILPLNDKNFSRWNFDQKYRNEFQIISGSDEAGRGAMAGPIVVASVIMKKDFFDARIKDSKKLSEPMREKLYDLILQNTIDFKVSIIDANLVDQLNPKAASIKGMKETISQLSLEVNCALVDGEQLINFEKYNPIKLIKGDDLSFSIACASIIAKVSRDRIMREYDLTYPEYGFATHKGYVTKFHLEKTQQYGVLDIHRKSYKPIKQILALKY